MKAVTEHQVSFLQSRQYHFLEVLDSICQVEEHFGFLHQTLIFLIQQDFANLNTDISSSRFKGGDDLVSLFFKKSSRKLNLGGLATPVNPFKRDECTGLHQSATVQIRESNNMNWTEGFGLRMNFSFSRRRC